MADTKLLTILAIISISISDCESQSSTRSFTAETNNGGFSTLHNSRLDTSVKSSHFRPSLVQGLTASFTATSHNVKPEVLSSIDYLPLVTPTVSSAYTGIKNDRKSTNSLEIKSSKSSEYQGSLMSANQLFKQVSDSSKLESILQISQNTFKDSVTSLTRTMENYITTSSSNEIHHVTLSDSFRAFSAGNFKPMKTSVTTNPHSIIPSFDLIKTVSTPSVSNVRSNIFHAKSFDSESTSATRIVHSRRPDDEWRAEIFPSVAYDQAMFSEFSDSLDLYYDVGITPEVTTESKSSSDNSKMTTNSNAFHLPVWEIQSSNTKMTTSNILPIISTISQILPTSSLLTSFQITTSFQIVKSQSMMTSPSVMTSSKMLTFSSQLLNSSIIPNKIFKESLSIQTSQIPTIHPTSSQIQPTRTFRQKSSLPGAIKATPEVFSTSESILRESIGTYAITQSTFEIQSSTERRHTTMSSAITTSLPKTTQTAKNVFKDCRFLFTFSGDCQLVTNNTLYLAEFIEGLRKTLVEKLQISNNKIKPHDISCGTIKIYVTFKNVSYPETAIVLKNFVDSKVFIVPSFIESQVVTFTAMSVREVGLRSSDIDSFDLPAQGLDNIDIIVIVVACCVCGVLVIIGISVCVKECYRRKYAQSFDLLDMPHVNLKLEDFTLTRIPRPKTTYNQPNVTANSYADRRDLSVNKENGRHVSNGNHIDLKDVHVRMQPLNEGLVIGLTGYSNTNGLPRKKKRAPSASSQLSNGDGLGNPSTESLVSQNNSMSMGASNPLFEDDDQTSTATLEISQTNSRLLNSD